MSRIVIAAGHGERNNTAFRGQEHEICREVAALLASWLDCPDLEVDLLPSNIYEEDNDTSLNRRVAWIRTEHQIVKFDLAIELHLNGGRGNYSTALHHPRSAKGIKAADRIGRAYEAAFAWDANGGRSEEFYGRTNLAWLHKTPCPAVICEPGFLDNPDHGWDSELRIKQYAAATLIGIMRCLEEEK
jgi:N-acetylmuramoyl-L-alanine amidase|tara:strand:+ start:3839 stop:4399 length:561 start_codon:yes stop_codon:yes gene_type:complete